MTIAAAPITPPSRVTSPSRRVVPLIAAIAVMMRLPGLGHAPWPDEAGFLVVGQQWHSGGSSLYGSYWVDRPPLLVTIFRFAAHVGGIVPLRLIGCVAVAGIVIGVGHVAQQMAVERAAMWAAICAAALCASPMLGTAEVNGELLSAPFVVAGIAASVRAIGEPRARRVWGFAMLAGAATIAALLTKQNMADVGVFAAVAGLFALREGQITRGRLAALVGGLVSGSLVVVVVMSGWTLAHGTSLSGVYYAVYPFRMAAGHVLATSTRSQASSRLVSLLGGWVASGLAVISLLVVAAIVTRRLHGHVPWALVATVAFASVSVLAGGNYWQHYLVELVVPVSILAGVLVARVQPGIRPTVTTAAVISAIGWGLTLPHAVASNQGAMVGSAIRAVSSPTDTIVTAYGNAEVTQASGLQSPYPYLWSLPAKTLDPDQRVMDAVLSGPSAPTWFVVWHQISTWGLQTDRTTQILSSKYHAVARLQGHTVYLHDGVDRAPPTVPTHALTTSAPSKEHLP